MTQYSRLVGQLFQHYSQGEYAQALACARQAAEISPEEAVNTTLWQACLLARLEQPDAAITVLQEGLEAGLWWSQPYLRQDDDLAPLHGLPDFEQLVSECENRHAAAQRTARPERLVYPPAEDAHQPYPLILALHGRFSSAQRAEASWRAAMGMGWLLALPQSSQVLSAGRFGWEDSNQAEIEIHRHLVAMREDFPLDPDRTILAGFSQGGWLAIRLALSGALPVRGFLAVAPAVRDWDLLDELLAGRPEPTPRGYLVTGGLDPWAPAFRRLQGALEAHGVPCQVEHHLTLEHAFPPQFEASLALGLGFIEHD